MRNAALLIIFVAFGCAANSQRFSLLPQVGFENSSTKISYNDLAFFSPVGIKFTPQASLRLNYSSRKGHGFFLGAATSRSTVSFGFTDPETLRSSYSATAGNLQVRMEGGYQFNSKPISLTKSRQTASASSEKKCCSSSSRCSRNSNKPKENMIGTTSATWLRLQPSVGMGYIPAVKSDVVTKSQAGQTIYQYNAGNWQTAFMAGAGFELGKGSIRKLTLSVNYFRGIGNLDEQTITSVSGGKTITTKLESVSSGWNLRLGVPLTLRAKPRNVQKREHRSSGCGQYRIIYRCRN